MKREAMALLEKMGLSDKADMYPCQLSGGQQQRVGDRQALVVDPQIIFADEPNGESGFQDHHGGTAVNAAHCKRTEADTCDGYP